MIAAMTATADLTGGFEYFIPRPGLRLEAPQIAVGSLSLRAAEQAPVFLPEGQVLNVIGAAGAVGKVNRLDPAGGPSILQSWVVGTGALAVIGPFVGQQRFQVTCSVGSIVASSQAAVLSSVRQATDVGGFNGARGPLQVGDVKLLPCGQPAGILRSLKNAGRMVANFGTGVWMVAGGTPPLTQGYTGYDALGNISGITSRTGQAEMLQWSPTVATTHEIKLTTFATGARVKDLKGRIGLWVYVDNLPGYEPGGTPTGSIGMTLTTEVAASNANALTVGFNSNQVREGWNFLKFVQRDPAAYIAASGITEYHPFGVLAGTYGTGAAANIRDAAITGLKIDMSGMAGANVYFDSLWTDFDSQAQIVLGTDSVGSDMPTYYLPIFDSYNWKGYVAVPKRIWTSGDKVVSDWTGVNPWLKLAYDSGWECINHSTNHLGGADATGTITSPSAIAYEVVPVTALYLNSGMTRGLEFYASPQSSTSRLSEKVIKGTGIKMQRHARKINITVTPWGIDNPHHVGACDWGSATAGGISRIVGGVTGSVAGWQKASQIKRMADVIVAYGDTWFPFWHGVTGLGDTGSGEDLTGDNLLLTKSAFEKSCAYIRQLQLAGSLRFCDGFTGFYYGTGQ